MKAAIVIAILLQGLCTWIWLADRGYLAEDYARERYELGYQVGKNDTLRELADRGVSLPSEMSREDLKDQMVGSMLGRSVHDWITLPLLIIAQGLVFVVLGVVVLRFRRLATNAQQPPEDAEQD